MIALSVAFVASVAKAITLGVAKDPMALLWAVEAMLSLTALERAAIIFIGNPESGI